MENTGERSYTKKPVTIQALEYTGDNLEEVSNFMPGQQWRHDPEGKGLSILTLEGDMLASPGDFIIRGVKGEYYPCKPDIFEATYNPA